MRASTMWWTTNNPTPTLMCGAGGFDNNILVNTPDQKTGFPPPHTRWGTGADRFSVVIAWGKRPVPSRTRKLRPTALMVLHSEGCGRVRHRRNSLQLRGCTPTGEHPLNAFNTHGQPWTAAPANARVAVHGFLLLTLVHHDPRSSPSPPGQWGDPHPALLPSLPSPCPGRE